MKMFLSEEEVEEFKLIYKKASGKEISNDEAREEATKLIELMRIIVDGLTMDIKDNSNFIIGK